MTTKVAFDENPRVKVSLVSLDPGSGFEFEGKLYIKLHEGHSVRLRGLKSFVILGLLISITTQWLNLWM